VNLAKLRAAMIGTLAGVIGGATLLLAVVMSLLGGWSTWLLVAALGFVVVFHFLQWLFAPYVIEAIYRVRPVDPGDRELGWLVSMVRSLAERSGLKRVPRVGLADVDIPNAFAYESPIAGPRIAVTRKLLGIAPREEIEAVIGHELGHLKHGDVKVMMIVSLVPALLYWAGQMLLRIGFYSAVMAGGSRRREGGGAAIMGLLGIGLIAASFLFNLFILYLSRLREYYADSHSAAIVPGGAYRLQRALARIMAYTGALKEAGLDTSRYSHLKALFIEDPDHVYVGVRLYSRVGDWVDRVVDEIKRMKAGALSDLFSTHPHPAKRFRFLDALAQQLGVS